MIEPNSPRGKALLAGIRGGDYAHAGEAEAIERAMAGLEVDRERLVLDVGCGRGGTAEWVRAHGYGQVTGVDVDSESIEYARITYPDCRFLTGDVVDLGELLEAPVDVAYAMNAFYAFPDLEAALAAVRAAVAEGGELRIFDYVHDDTREPARQVRGGRTLGRHELERALERTGWQIGVVRDLSGDYERWYEDLCTRIDARRSTLAGEFGEAAVVGFRGFYGELLAQIRAGEVGGALILAHASAH